MILPGAKAPAFQLPALTGENWALADALSKGPLVLAFFKIACPTCQFTLPFLNRMATAAGGSLRVVGISQDDASGTGQFLERFAPGLPTLLDSEGGYLTSKAFGITHVPSVFIVEQDGTIAGAADGFHKQMMEDLGVRGGVPAFLPGEQVPEMRPG